MTDDRIKARRTPDGEATQIAPRSAFALAELISPLVATLTVAVLLAFFFMPNVRQSRQAARRDRCKYNLKYIAIALHNYADRWNSFPPAYTVDADGRPLHSWRTLILPYLDQRILPHLDQRELYDRIDLTKAWDDPANAEAYNTPIDTYRCLANEVDQTHTTYLAVIAPGSWIHPTEPRQVAEASDKDTLMVIEVSAAQAVHWMSPQDADENQVLTLRHGSESTHEGGLHAAFADGSVRQISDEVTTSERRKWITYSEAE